MGYSVNQILTSSTILSRPPIHWLDPKNVSFSAGLEQPFFLENGLPVDTTPNFMLGTMFKYFRGGFKFKVKCNKTRFHAGRLALVFTPYTDISHSYRKLYVPEQTEMDLYSQVTIWDLTRTMRLNLSVLTFTTNRIVKLVSRMAC